MDKDLYKQIIDMQKQNEELSLKYNKLNHFLDDYKRFFEEEQSIEALKKVEDFKYEMLNKLSENRNNYRKLKHNLEKSCEHSVLIKWTHRYGYECLACGEGFNDDNPKVDEAEVLINGLDENLYFEIMKNLCTKLIFSGENLSEGVIEKIREMDNEDIFVRRR